MGPRVQLAAVAATAVLLIVSTAGCSSGGSGTTPTADYTPAVSLPGDAPNSVTPMPESTVSTTQNFSRAVEFTRLVHIDDYGAAGGLVADNSPAARYIAHQTAYRRAFEANGQPISKSDPSNITVDGDAKTGAIKIESVEGDDTTTYTWKDFSFDASGKVASWTGKSGPIDKALWSKSDSAHAHDVTAKLVSAYVTNGGDLIVVAELASRKRAIRVDDAVYTPHKGYRQQDNAGLYTDVGKGEKAMTVFDFPKAKIGGKLKLELGRVDSDDPSSSYGMGSVTLRIK